MGVTKKAKPSPKGGSLLAKIKKAVGQALTKKLSKETEGLPSPGEFSTDFPVEMGALPQVDVPIISTPVTCEVKSLGTIGDILKKHQAAKPGVSTSSDPSVVLKKWQEAIDAHLKGTVQIVSGMPHSADVAHFIKTLKAGAKEIHANTAQHPGNFLDFSPEDFEAVKGALEKKLTEIAGTPTPVGVAKVEDVQDVKLVDIAGVPTLTGKATLGVISASADKYMYCELADPKTPDDTISAYTATMKLGSMPDSLSAASAQTVIKARMDAMIHHDLMVHALAGTKQAGLVLSVAEHKIGEEAEDYRAYLRGWWTNAHEFFCALAALVRAEKVKFKKLVGFKAEDFIFQAPYQPVYTTPALMSPTPSSKLHLKVPSKKAKAELEEWICYLVKTVLEYTALEPFDKTGLFLVRDMLSKHYDATLESGGVGPPVLFEILGKQLVMHRVAQRLGEALSVLHGKLNPADVKLFNEVFPPPRTNDQEAMHEIEPLVGSSGPQEPAFVKSQEELEAAFGKPDPSSPISDYTAILLKNAQEYIEKHPEAQGVGPLDGAGIVQTMAPFQVVNPNSHIYPKDLWDKVVKKLQPKFSKKAEQDAKEQGLGDAAEGLLIFESADPGIIPEAEVKVIIENGEPFIVTTMNGEVIEKKPAIVAKQQITQKGHETLDRFGAVLVSEPEHILPGVYAKELDLKHLVPPPLADHIELSFMVDKNKGKP